jgi:antitoxin component of RelBE/YafQ-DinJ toxin-antitoxin module
MKTILLFTVLFTTISANSQSLLDAVYSGKLKADTGAVLRKGDSLKIKENMAQKVIADSVRKDSIAAAIAAAAIEKQNATFSAKDTVGGINTSTATNVNTAVVSTEAMPIEKNIPKDNNRIWKAFIDSLTTTIKSEVLSSGKIKKGAYSVLINYDIRPDGQISINSVASDPQSSFLDEQIKLRLTLDSPQLNPVLGTNGQPRTVAKKQMLTLVK